VRRISGRSTRPHAQRTYQMLFIARVAGEEGECRDVGRCDYVAEEGRRRRRRQGSGCTEPARQADGLCPENYSPRFVPAAAALGLLAVATFGSRQKPSKTCTRASHPRCHNHSCIGHRHVSLRSPSDGWPCVCLSAGLLHAVVRPCQSRNVRLLHRLVFRLDIAMTVPACICSAILSSLVAQHLLASGRIQRGREPMMQRMRTILFLFTLLREGADLILVMTSTFVRFY
jgi:hypothetical protein